MQVTYHAKIKYMRIVAKKGREVDLDHAERAVLKIYRQSKKEEDNPGLFKRFIDNKFEKAEYFRYGDWRVVVIENTIVTIEENVIKYVGPGHLTKHSLYRNSAREREKKRKFKYRKKEI